MSKELEVYVIELQPNCWFCGNYKESLEFDTRRTLVLSNARVYKYGEKSIAEIECENIINNSKFKNVKIVPYKLQALEPISNDEVNEDIEWLNRNNVFYLDDDVEVREGLSNCINRITSYISQLESTPTSDEIVKELLSKPYKVIYDYDRGFIVTLFEQELYVSHKKANLFKNAEDSRSSILLEYGKTLKASDEND